MSPIFPKFTIDSQSLPRLNPVKIVFKYSLAGVHRARWLHLFVILAILLPGIGFISQEIHLANSPIELFMAFQYGLQHYGLLLFSLVAMARFWQDENIPGIHSALNAAGIRPIEQLLGKNAAIGTLIIAFQLLLTLIIGLLSLVWKLDSTLDADAFIKAQANLNSLLSSAYANIWMVLVVVSLIRFLWILTHDALWGFMGGISITFAGLTQPVWAPYFRHEEHLPFVFRILGRLLEGLVPAFWQFDLWIVRHDAMIHSMGLHLIKLTLMAAFWILFIHIASWAILRIKRP